MKKVLPLLFSVVMLASCSNQVSQLPVDENAGVQAQAAGDKTLKFEPKKLANPKDPKAVNPKPETLVVKVKKLVKKNSSNPNQDNVYYQLANAVENLANLDVSYDNTAGGQTYQGDKVFEFVKNANQGILRVTSIDPSLQSVDDIIKALDAGNRVEGNVQFSDIKVFNALVYQALLDSYDGQQFNLTAQRAVSVFSQFPQFAQQFDDSARYMRQAIRYYATKYSSLASFSNVEPFNGESWDNYTRRLRQMLQQISKMGK
ncbi:MAG: hypothetical protein U0457_15275 [Candidatus Sericytochromatia bacterium]